MVEIEEREVYLNSKKIHASYGSRELFGQWIAAAFGFTVFFYYEVVIGLDTVIAALAFILYIIWNAVNDPLIGYLMERLAYRMPWEKKWGIRRIPWMILSAPLWLLAYLLIFLVPNSWYGTTQLVTDNQWLIFSWFLVTICLYDTFGTLFDVNVLSIYPDKFPGLNERRAVQGYGTILGIIGLVLAAIIPPMFIQTGVAITYRNSALATLVIGLVLFLAVIPGAWENKRLKELYEQRKQTIGEEKVESFFKTTKTALSDRRFMMKIIFFFGYQISGVMIQTSGFYITTFILDAPAQVITYLLGAMLLGALISVPVWTSLSKKINNNKKLGLISGWVLFFTFLPMIFVTGLVPWMISLVLFGIGIGGSWFIDPPMMGDVLDHLTVKTGKAQHAIYYGFQSFFIRFGHTFIVLTIALTHIFTGFIEGATDLATLLALSPTPELALFGIRIHSAIVPAIIALIAIILFWKFYDLTPEKVEQNKEKLKDLGL